MQPRRAVRGSRPRTIPLRRFSPYDDPRPRTVRHAGVAHAVFRSANVLAVVPGVRVGVVSTSRRVAAAKCELSHHRSIVRAGIDRRNRIQCAHDDPSHQAPPQYICRSIMVMHQTPFFARCSATTSNLHGLAGMTGPSLLRSSSGAHGIFTLRRFAPADGWNRVSALPGPRAVRIRQSSPINFRRA